MADLHPTAIVSSKAVLGNRVVVGPYSIVGEDVVLGDGVRLHGHVVLDGRTRIGAGTEIFPFASIGYRPQDLKYAGEASTLEIGANNTIREYVTMNPGTTGGGMVTKVGSGGLFMVGSHVAHDCRIGDRVIMANNATLAGHVVVEDDAIIGGLAAVHQHVRVGRHAMVGGMSGVEHDVIPFGLVVGDRATLNGLNVVGLKRRGFTREDIQALQTAYEAIFASNSTMDDRLCEIERRFGDNNPVLELLSFIRGQSARALCKPKPGNAG